MNTAEPIARAAMLAAPIFRSNGWTWGGREEAHVPDIEEIANTIRGLLATLDESGGPTVGSGRLTVYRGDDGEVAVDMQLGVLRDGVAGV